MSKYVITLISFCLLFKTAATFAQHDNHGQLAADQIGSTNVKFETSCAPAVSDEFNRAVALLHSFWFAEAVAGFEQVLTTDANCAMAHWGIALSHWGNPFAGLRSPVQLSRGKAAIDKALSTGSPTQREQAWVDAAAQLFSDDQSSTQRARVLAYEQAMENIVKAYPEDREATIFYALAVNQTALPSDKTYAQQLKAASLLEPLFHEDPQHPGLAHYIIHAYDHPPLAEKALDAARRYAALAPAIPHALHMPSHTFTRVGLWKESIETNLRSAEAARESSTAGEELHALDYQTYAYLQTAQDKAASKVLERAMALVEGVDSIAIGATGAGAFATAAIPARYTLERGAFAEAAALTVHPGQPYTEAITHFARALGAARSGNPQAAAADVERLAVLRDRMIEAQDAYWSEQVEIQRQVATAWMVFAEGKHAEGIAQLEAAAAMEDKTDKSAVSPGPLAPARELLGFMLLDAERPDQALPAFEATMIKEPNRFLSLYGAARAAGAVGDAEKEQRYYRQLLEVAGEADTDRPELQRAKSALGLQ
jgi:hypothetical protein